MTDLEKIKKDLETFSDSDLNILFEKYKVDNLDDLSKSLLKFHHTALLPEGDIFDAIYNDNFANFMEFVNDPSFNINQIDIEGRTPLMYAMQRINIFAVTELLKRNPNLNIQNNEGKTALMISINTLAVTDPKIIKELIEKGADVNLQDNDGYTALMDYLEYLVNTYDSFDLNIFKLFVDKVVSTPVGPGQIPNIDKQNPDGFSALTHIIRFGFIEEHLLEIVKILIQAGANVNSRNTTTVIRNKGQTALIIASSRPGTILPVIKVLLEAKADPNIQDNDGKTALMVAQNYNIIVELIKAGADPNIMDNKGKTVLDYENENVVAQVYLLKFMKNKDISKYKNLIQLKILETREELEKYKSKLNNLELDRLNENCNETETGDIVELENITRCVKTAKKMKKYRPGKGKVLELEKKYHKKLATREKGTK